MVTDFVDPLADLIRQLDRYHAEAKAIQRERDVMQTGLDALIAEINDPFCQMRIREIITAARAAREET